MFLSVLNVGVGICSDVGIGICSDVGIGICSDVGIGESCRIPIDSASWTYRVER